MLKINEFELPQFDDRFPKIAEAIHSFESSALPVCLNCDSDRTAVVHCGLVGRSIHIAAATDKFKLIANGPKPGQYFCNSCNTFFDAPSL